MTIRLRPHHVLCAIGFDEVGYKDAFTANFSNITRGQLRACGGSGTEVLITGQADSLCAPCPSRRGLGCEFEDRIDRIDAMHLEALGLEIGARLSWGDCLDTVRDSVVPDDLDRICAGCTWLPLGMCKANLARLIETGSDRGSARPPRIGSGGQPARDRVTA